MTKITSNLLSSNKIRRVSQHILLIFGVVGTIVSMAGDWAEGNHLINNWFFQNSTILISFLHIILVLLILFPARIKPLTDNVGQENIQKLSKLINNNFLLFWSLFWIAIGLLFTVILYKESFSINQKLIIDNIGVKLYTNKIIELVFMDLFDIMSSIFIYWCFISLTPQFLISHERPANNTEKTSDGIDWDYYIKETWFIVLLACSIVFLRGFCTPFLIEYNLHQWIPIAIGLFATVVFALLIGRLDTKFIYEWQWAIGLLFVYAAIQVYSIVFYSNDNAILRVVFSYIAFTMKVVLFIFVSELFETRKIVFYAHEMDKENNQKL